MYMLGFMAVSVIGAFIAWRHNPLYTLGRTVRFLLVLGLMLTAFVCAIQVVIHLTAASSQAVQLTAILGITGLGTVGIIGGIIEVSLPAGIALPKGTKLVRVHRGKVDTWARRAGWGVLVLGALALVLPTTGKIVVGTIGGLFVFLAIATLFAGYMSARRMDKWLTEVELRPWAHWTYTAEQWSQWNALRVHAVEAQPDPIHWREAGWKSLLLGGITVAAVLLLDPGGWRFKVIFLGGTFGFLALVVWLSHRSWKDTGKRTTLALAKAAPEVYFGDEGLFADGLFLPWTTTGVYLVSAERASGEPAHLDFQFVKVGAGSASTVVTQSVLLPDGDVAADLARLQKEISAQCATATVELVRS